MIVGDAFQDARTQAVPLSLTERGVLQAIELHARDDCFSFPGNAELTGRCKLTTPGLLNILDRLEAKGCIQVVMKTSGRPGRLGFILLRRADPGRPVFDPGRDDPDRAVAGLCHRRGIPLPAYRIGRAMGQVSLPTMGQVSLPTMGQVSLPQSETSLSSSRGISNQTTESSDPFGSDERQRQRPEGPPPVPTPPCTPSPAPAPAPTPPCTPTAADATPPEAPALTEGQRRAVAALSDAQRAIFDVLPEKKRAAFLAPHAAAFDPHMLKVQLADSGFRAPKPVTPPPPPPADTAELIRGLPGSDPSWPQMAAEDLARKFGTDKDRGLWGQFQAIMLGVAAGRIDPGHVTNALGQAMRPGIENRGAKFWAAFKGLSGLDEHDLKAPGWGRGVA
jgi:hypothetical protein